MSSSTEQAAAPHQTYDTILTLDFGSQYTHLITRRLRECNVYSEMLPCTTKLSDLTWKPKGIILSGGPYSVYDKDAPHADPAFFDLGVPVLGICYGLQELAWRLGKDNVVAGTEREYGHADLTPQKNSQAEKLFKGMGDDSLQVWMSHGDKLSQLPTGFQTIATTTNSPFAAIAQESQPIFGVQFHPEVTHTRRGLDLLRNFAVGICGAQQNWNMHNFIEQEISRIRNLIGDKAQVIGAVSGGVDSTVAAKLMKEAIGDRFHAVLVDQGVMRHNECAEVKKALQDHLGINLTVADASERFLSGLKGVEDPEQKRKFIGNTFIDIFEEEAIKIEKAAENTPNAGKVEWFLQGTLYPDVIESISFKGPSATIKTHHNVGGLPKRMMEGQGLRLIEPLRELFKDEVRAMGRELKINEELVMRHPFPGPGIAIRILGEVTRERVEIARKADHIFISMIKEAGIYNEISQAYAALDTSRAVGVMETRVYDFIEDKLQSTTDLDHLDSLLASVEHQRTQLQTQLDDATRELDAARRSGGDRQEELARQIDDFEQLQRSIDVRLQIVSASDAPDEAIRRLEPPMHQLHRVNLARDYLKLLHDIEGLRRQARDHLPADPKAALLPYSRLKQLSSRLAELQGMADGAATHLVAHVAGVADALWDEMKQIMSDEMKVLLAARRWPAEVQPDLVVDEEWRGCFEKLLDLQVPEVLYSPPDVVLSLLPIDVMAQIWVKEFRFHFLSDGRPTSNNRLIGQHCFPWVIRLVSTWEDFFRENFGHSLASRFIETSVSSKMIYLDPVCALITCLLPVLREKIMAAAEEAILDPSFLSSFMTQLMGFDDELRTRFGYDGGDSDSDWDGLTAEVLNLHFTKWLQAEKDFALERFEGIMDSADARKIDYDYGGPGKTKPTFGAVRVSDLLRSVTSQYERVRRFSHKLRFLIDIQVAILDDFHDRLRGSLEFYYSLTSTVGRTLHGATAEQLASLEGTGALETLCKVYGSADHIANALEDWSNEEFFVVFWEELQARAKKTEDQENLAGGLSYDNVKDKTSASIGDDGDGGVIFDETIAAYSARRKAARDFLVSALVDSHQEAFRPYLKRTQWTTISDDPAQADPYQLPITAELDEPLRILKRNLEFVNRALSTAAFRRVWREALDKLDETLWHDVLTRHSFTAFGAAQFMRDLHAVVALVERYIPEGGGLALARVQEGVRLLNLPMEADASGKAAAVTLRQASDRVFKDNEEAKRLLEELGIDLLSPTNARHILQRRVEMSD
ncbi:hypothetical protein PspLS_03343 [Pyricularia sp. CBS 133598]|nr:hypothetical protein PspLS_03343 [Pyricularia sp. CBS 133598]